MDFLIKGLLTHNADGSGTSSGRLFIEERDVRALYEYLQNGEPFGPGDDRAIPLQIHGERCREEDGTASLRLTVQPDPKYRKKEVQFGAEALAAAFNGEILSAQLVEGTVSVAGQSSSIPASSEGPCAQGEGDDAVTYREAIDKGS